MANLTYVHLHCIQFLKETVHGNYHCPDDKCQKIYSLQFNDKTLSKTHLRQKRILYGLNLVCFVAAALLSFAFVLLFYECNLRNSTQRCFDVSYIVDTFANLLFWLGLFIHLPYPEYYVFFQGTKESARHRLRIELVVSIVAMVIGLLPLLILGSMFDRSFQAGIIQVMATCILVPALIYTFWQRYLHMNSAIESMKITLPRVSLQRPRWYDTR